MHELKNKHMKRKGISKQTIARYMAAFIEIKAAIDANPKCHTSHIARQFKIGQHPITMLKQLGVIEQKNGCKKWVGNAPNVTMVIQIAEAVHNYHAELRSRKSNGEMFTKKNRVQATKKIEPTESDLNEWKTRYSEYNAPKTNIPIQSAIFDKSTADHSIEHHGVIESTKRPPRRFNVKIFGIKLFSFKY